ncbi:biotin carboxylase N-terminal domain-containing protein [Gordonia sp. (in: high G+C Gram-positive bacteria)]|jgi:propionyl-CoA carboxylase alpha chain|uniref:ATP-binding protein n=1 Tax=Gordonia sp. (in: high G+C Gram-positive bacteria) TaxID=84139 RepID=UPI001E0B5915|nr:biotin carboxylase N-terminal domain-containing protein [Gordonia sp. (in: high G+C Gram-positive bacteria)]MCB1293407.1 biotin/lipoyl-binding protein [Gordonia sp. (in: high G+C Gram-positive bacteria)]HMS74739.1 biotin carboxylase N-terminal domain-containing protein [Gordonia sp. (in: high G+C Gram-positive bacteria)]HQV17073.1 biotin carboxylase N-terminal domain-containing protein [Gordonia sp. (in: high G+C Gram-positive bacteria)]
MGITSVLVANRGEIACRVFATCKRMGLSTVAVFSDPDAGMPHVRAADVAVRLPGETSAETYLRGDAIIAAARSAGADAIHPGYGFLSENAGFAQAVLDAGLVWIGPPPAAIEAMGDKVNAKELMDRAGVPVLGSIDPASATEADLPLLIKASAGGGGRGMRIVRELAELESQVAAAAREAQSAFGDPTVFCEPYIERGHHIEVQILADAHGGVWAVGERECSIQRRHQKVVEEAPAPLVERVGGDLRERLFTAARDAAKAIDYVGAGTVEFLADEQGRFYFLETNTRLQVEHPVTELTTGTDLVEWQVRVADGEALDAAEPVSSGHAIEVRLYAEDPAADWQPQSGAVHSVAIAADSEFAGLARPGIRVDAGIESGSVISTFYDPMLAKVISWAPDRRRAAAMLARALSDATLHGPVTNRDLLVNILRDKDFLDGHTDTGFLDASADGYAALVEPAAGEEQMRLAALAAALADAAANRASAGVQAGLPGGWRNLASGYQTKKYVAVGDTDEIVLRYRLGRGGYELPDHSDVQVVGAGPDEVRLDVDGVRRALAVSRYDDVVHVDGPGTAVALRVVPRFTDPSAVQKPGSLLAPMPGSVIRVAVAQGDTVAAGQPLIWLEAMKMEHTITAPADGIVETLAVVQGQQLSVGDVLAVITEATEGEPT